MNGKAFEGKVAIVTGGGRGIGREVALKFASQGASLVINDLDEAAANEVAVEVRAKGGNARVVAGSISAAGFPEQAVSCANDELGGLDIIVNNAGYTWDGVIQKMTDEQWDAMIDVHLKAPFRLLRAAYPVIRARVREEQERGVRVVRKIINVSSVSGVYGNAGQSNYSSAKAGIIGLTKTLAKEWGRLNVTVNCVAFGLIHTRLSGDVTNESTVKIEGRDMKVGINSAVRASVEKSIPLGRGGTPEEGAGAIYLFAIPESDYVSGQLLECSGGLSGFH